MKVTNQGGSLAGFIIIGVLLTLILVGGLYGLNRYNAQKAAEEVATSEEKAAEAPKSTSSDKEKEAPKPDSESTTGRERTDTSGSSSTQPQTQTTPPAEESQTQKADGQLPQTGPADVLFSFIALGLLTFAAAHYARSRA